VKARDDMATILLRWPSFSSEFLERLLKIAVQSALKDANPPFEGESDYIIRSIMDHPRFSPNLLDELRNIPFSDERWSKRIGAEETK
jgi:hypothetical protein